MVNWSRSQERECGRGCTDARREMDMGYWEHAPKVSSIMASVVWGHGRKFNSSRGVMELVQFWPVTKTKDELGGGILSLRWVGEALSLGSTEGGKEVFPTCSCVNRAQHMSGGGERGTRPAEVSQGRQLNLALWFTMVCRTHQTHYHVLIAYCVPDAAPGIQCVRQSRLGERQAKQQLPNYVNG